MTCFLQNGNDFFVASEEELNLHNPLPINNYVIKLNPIRGYYLEKVGRFPLPKKLYGKCAVDTRRVLNTFSKRGGSTGCCFVGEKGSGKTLLAKNICTEALDDGIPTLIVSSPFHGEAFNTFVKKIEQPCVMLFDEFEKVYVNADDDNGNMQLGLLTLLDGVFNSNKLFILTCNDKWKIDSHLRNRPGRVFYLMEFSGIDQDFIAEYCLDNLHDHSQIESICSLAMLFNSFNFDMLQSLVEEMNRYGETAKDALRMLNIKPEGEDRQRYSIRMFFQGQELRGQKEVYGHILGETFAIFYFTTKKTPRKSTREAKRAYQMAKYALDEDGEYDEPEEKEDKALIALNPADLKKIDRVRGEYIFENSEGFTVVFKRIFEAQFNYEQVL